MFILVPIVTQEGPYILLGPQNHNKDGRLGPNSIIVYGPPEKVA